MSYDLSLALSRRSQGRHRTLSDRFRSKTAFFASDPNLGRILAAIGYAGVALDSAKIDLHIDDVLVASRGGRNPGYREEQAVAAMKKPEFTVRAVLNRGKADATVWTCDLSFDYVKINAEYRS